MFIISFYDGSGHSYLYFGSLQQFVPVSLVVTGDDVQQNQELAKIRNISEADSDCWKHSPDNVKYDGTRFIMIL